MQKACANCEYFDGGGIKPNGQPVEQYGDCLNSASDRFQTSATDVCTHWLKSTTLAGVLALLTACAPKLIEDTSARQTCVPVKKWPAADQEKLSADLKVQLATLPAGATKSVIERSIGAIGDYISLRDILRACANP